MSGQAAFLPIQHEMSGLSSDEKLCSPSTSNHLTQAQLLRGGPVVAKIASWCRKHSRSRHGVLPTLGVVYFDTGADADEYLYIKAIVAARAGVNYTVYKLCPEASMKEVSAQIAALNDDDQCHGILIQRPLPEHLCEAQVMNSVERRKHIEEFSRAKTNNIAFDGLYRLLDSHSEACLPNLNILLLGGTNIITPGFKAALEGKYKHVRAVQNVNTDLIDPKHDTIIITELNKGGAIRPEMLGPAIRMIVDLGFDVNTKVGDLDPTVLDMDDLLVVPTPHGVLPVLLWVMMERTIKARDQLVRSELVCLPHCAVL